MREQEFEDEVDQDGLDCENSLIRRLYYILIMPTSDLLGKKDNSSKHSQIEKN